MSSQWSRTAASGWVPDVAGLTSTGFEAKTAAEILSDVETAQKADGAS